MSEDNRKQIADEIASRLRRELHYAGNGAALNGGKRIGDKILDALIRWGIPAMCTGTALLVVMVWNLQATVNLNHVKATAAIEANVKALEDAKEARKELGADVSAHHRSPVREAHPSGWPTYPTGRKTRSVEGR